jgi:transcriptional repressor of cell division inhibition gene dicB
MKTADALKHFGSNTALTQALGLSTGAVSQWGEYPPAFRQLQIEKLTRGRLKAEEHIVPAKQKVSA